VEASAGVRGAEKASIGEKPAVNIANRSADHLVIGGGLAGSTVAIHLAAAGRQVTLLEREPRAHHKVCGEFLSREAVAYLAQLGVDPISLGAQTIRSVRLTARNQVFETKLPFTALSLSRYVLDEVLIKRAADSGCTVERGAFVERVAQRDGEWTAHLRGGASWTSATVFLASGKHELRGNERGPGQHGDLVGFKLHWRLAPAQTAALCDSMDLFLFRGGYGGLSLVEGNTANLCLVVRRAMLVRAGGWKQLLDGIQSENAHIAQRLSGAQALWARPLAVSSIPYGYIHAGGKGLWCVGDQAAVIPSFTGDGMSIALHSGALAAEMYLAGAAADVYHCRLDAHLRPSMRLATGLSRAMVSGMGRRLAPIGFKILPKAMSWIARATRIPEQALVRTRVDGVLPQTTP
jgi:flavin-dependent dehydrogenase